jgi:hypothetical protein
VFHLQIGRITLRDLLGNDASRIDRRLTSPARSPLLPSRVDETGLDAPDTIQDGVGKQFSPSPHRLHPILDHPLRIAEARHSRREEQVTPSSGQNCTITPPGQEMVSRLVCHDGLTGSAAEFRGARGIQRSENDTIR